MSNEQRDPRFNRRIEIYDGDKKISEMALTKENYAEARIDADDNICFSRTSVTGVFLNDHGAQYSFSTFEAFKKYVDSHEAYLRWLIEGAQGPRPEDDMAATHLENLPEF